MSKTIVLIPARMESTRCPNKPLADINGKTMIRRIYENVKSMTDYDVCVAAGDQRIVDEIISHGGKAVLTEALLPSGSDRIYSALQQLDPTGKTYDTAVSFQGDSINVDPKVITTLVELREKTGADITTPVKIMDEDLYHDVNSVKAISGFKEGEDEARALYFTRATAPYDRDKVQRDLYHHLGIYVYDVKALKKFVESPQGILEKRESLEQLRALELGMKIWVKIINDIRINPNAPADVDTMEELEAVRKVIMI